MRSHCLLALLLGSALALACGPAPVRDRVIVLGIDGVDPDVVDLLIEEGKLPNFRRLREEGAAGRLRSSKPLLSPIIWTTIATGKPPLEHGVSHFVAINEQTGERIPVTSQMRRVKALWNILSESEREVAVVGWWATWPAESVRGAVVSDHTCYHFLSPEGAGGGSDPVGLTHPPELFEQVAPMILRPADLSAAQLEPFVRVVPEELNRSFDFEDELSHFKWALATAESYRRIGLDLWRTQRPDLLMVYIEGVDSTSHLFGHLFRHDDFAGHLAAQQARFGGTVEAMYHYADRLVGEYLNEIDEHTTLVVLSDHGFELGALHSDPNKARDLRRVSERYHRMDGILYFYGNRVRPGSRIDAPTLLDVTPTLLALTGISPARDMTGRVLSEVLDLSAEARFEDRIVATYETKSAGRAGTETAGDANVDPQILEHLRALGYIGVRSPQGDRNLAMLHFGEGRYAEAVETFEALLRENPKDGYLRASLAGALGALGRLDESLAQLDQAIDLEPVNPGAYHNRGAIYERQGKTEAAMREYETALQYDPGYAPARRALIQLRGGPPEKDWMSPDQERAAELAEQARSATLRGDYEGALQRLDEAEQLAPDFAQVHHYRANVAFLMGDQPGAIEALRRAIELEPDNPLHRTNLKRLQAGRGGAAPRSEESEGGP
jgi:predicted AlkP superfamily phosphohydrolase/phosphomutase/regulator of sirC expression with transglutaminase-like and TPR domain